MDSNFNKEETQGDICSRIYIETLELFSTLTINKNLADMHRFALSAECSESDRNDLVMGAYRTLFLFAGLAKYRMARELQDEAAGDIVANRILNDSGIQNIVRMIRESVDVSCEEPMQVVAKEAGMLFQAATMFDRMVRYKQVEKAFEVWRACAKGAYSELPMIYAR